MTETEKMLLEINDVLRMVGDGTIDISPPATGTSELVFLRRVREEYTRRLLKKVPEYAALRSDAVIPDMFLQALRNREAELEPGNHE
ncbi:MAG: hypothetical protein ACKVP0_28455 [Pirellulaceae bacterium]